MLGNLFDFDPSADAVPYPSMLDIDRFALTKLQHLIDRARKAYETYEFHVIYHSLYNYCTVSLSSLYFDMLKDRLYTFAADNPARRSSQTALNLILHALARMLAPTLSFTAEEAWGAIPNQPDLEPSIHLCSWPQVDRRLVDEKLESRWKRLLKIRGGVTKALEKGRKDGLIGNSLEAKLTIYPKREEEYRLIDR